MRNARALIYTRISDDRTSTKAGVRRQEADCRALCESRGWQVVEVLTDNDISASGYKRKQRPAYKRLLELLEQGHADAVVAWHTDRLYRQPKELEALIDLAGKVTVATCHGDFDLSTGDGRLGARILVSVAAKESDDKSRRIRRKHLELAAEGKRAGGGQRAFGYTQDDRIDRAEARLVREAAKRVLAGDSVRSIVMDWRKRGVPTVTGAAWQPTTLRRLLCSGRISGQREHQGVITARATWPAIVTPEQTTRLRAILRDPNRDTAKGVRARYYLLAGFLYCARCERTLVAMPVYRKGHRYRRYTCPADRGGCGCGIVAQRLEDDIVAAVLHTLENVKPTEPADGPEDSVVLAIEQTEADLSGLGEDMRTGLIGHAAYTVGARALETRLHELRRELRATRPESATAEFVNAGEAWETIGFDRQRMILARAIERITVEPGTKAGNFYDPDRWEITWR